MIAFIDDHREAYGVEPICKVLPIAPSTYHDHVAKRADPAKLSARAKQDAIRKIKIRRVVAENFDVYGVRKVWRQLRREGEDIARCTVERLMRSMGLQGVIRGKPVKTISDKAAPCPLDHVNRQFRAPRPNALWVSDFTYVATWTGFVYVAFVIDAYARRIVGWRASRTAHASFVLDALEQALHDRRPVHRDGLVHHSDRGSQYASIKYPERVAEAGIAPSVGSVGDSYDNALAETINGLYKAEVIHRRGPWRSFEAVEFATLEWVDRFNNRRLLEPIGNIPPDEAEERYYAVTEHVVESGGTHSPRQHGRSQIHARRFDLEEIPRGLMARRSHLRKGEVIAMKLKSMFLSSATALVLGAFCTASPFAADPIKLGLIEDISGDLATYGIPKLHGSLLAVDEINKAGGIMGRPIAMTHLDPQGDNARYQEFARRFLDKDQVDVLIGGETSASREAIRPIVDKHDVPYFYTNQYEGGVCDAREFSTGAIPEQQFSTLIPYMVKTFGPKSYVIAADYKFRPAFGRVEPLDP